MKRLFVVMCLLPSLLFGAGKRTKCDEIVNACEEVVKAQDQAIVNLKKSVVVLKQELESEKKRTPAWMLILGGIAAGVILNSTVGK
ncbi:MAG: hypothetical protein EBR82_81970 [Caulobacteraceae bacterium]|nr:hypothetical protein [Caulobacteraceae bacterium]